MKGKKVGYIRVSTTDQNPDRQLNIVDLDKRFIDYASGSSLNRPQLEALIDYVREDDIVIVHSLDRLGRNLKDIIDLIHLLRGKGVQIEFLKENLKFSDKSDAMSNLLLCVFGAIAEFEYSLIKERQQEGIARAKREGKYSGRKKIMTLEKIEELKTLMQTRLSISKIAKQLGCSRSSIYKVLKDGKNKDL